MKDVLGQSHEEEIQGLWLPGHIPAWWPARSNHKRPVSEGDRGKTGFTRGFDMPQGKEKLARLPITRMIISLKFLG